jgi:hypothetical protein
MKLPSLKTALLFDTVTVNNKTYIAMPKNNTLSWVQVHEEEHTLRKKTTKSQKNGTPSCSPESAGVFQIRQGRDKQHYIATYNSNGLLEWRRYATMYSDNTCTVTHLTVPSNAFDDV